MGEISGIYDSDVIQPIAKIKENLSIWTVGKWKHHRIENIEPMPRGSPMIVEMVAASGATNLGAYGTIAQQVVAILQLNELEFTHLRWEPIDDVEGILWEQASSGRFVTRSAHARVTRFTSVRDPYLVSTTFWVLGRDRDMNLEVRNPNPNVLSQARFVFWGYRYMLTLLDDATGKSIEESRAKTCWVPAEGF